MQTSDTRRRPAVRGRRALLALAAVLALTAIGGAAVALANRDTSALAVAKEASAPYRNVAVAERAGYSELTDAKKIACIQMPGVGGMGVHYVNGTLVGDATIDPRKPEALVYQPTAKGLHLVALEYIVFAAKWKQAAPPELFGRTFDYTPRGNRFGLPAFWALHAWVWKPNPTGTVMAWNPTVTCR